jgi:hypothetical protein
MLNVLNECQGLIAFKAATTLENAWRSQEDQAHRQLEDMKGQV